MSQHLYLAVVCFNTNCETAHVLKYIGPFTGDRDISALVPLTFRLECDHCGRSSWYRREQVFPLVTEQAPPPDFRSSF